MEIFKNEILKKNMPVISCIMSAVAVVLSCASIVISVFQINKSKTEGYDTYETVVGYDDMSEKKHYNNDYIDKEIESISRRYSDPDEPGISEEERQKRIKDNDLNDFLIRSLRNARGDIIVEDLNPEGEVEHFGPRRNDFGSKRVK